MNLKPYLDAALAADADVKRIMLDIDAAFKLESEEGTQKALEMRPALDAAKLKAEAANQLYVSMRDSSLVSDNAAALFVPPADPAQSDPAQSSQKVMKNSEFQALSPAKRMEYVKSGGVVED
jgi:hypothetical protein